MAGPIGGCPGQDSRFLTTSLHKCPECGHEVEMFSDEQSVRCPQCRTRVTRESSPSCIQWCSKARECIGEDRWRALFGPEK